MKFYLKVLLFIFVLFSLLNGNANHDIEKMQFQYKYILVFNQVQLDGFYTKNSGITSSKHEFPVFYIDSNQIFQYVDLDTLTGDTLTIHHNIDRLQIGIRVNGIDEFYFYLSPGNIYTLSTKNKIPFITTTNTQNLYKPYFDSIQNIQFLLFQHFKFDRINPLCYLRNDTYLKIYKSIEEIRKNKALKRLEYDYVDLDSLNNALRPQKEFILQKINETKNQDLYQLYIEMYNKIYSQNMIGDTLFDPTYDKKSFDTLDISVLDYTIIKTKILRTIWINGQNKADLFFNSLISQPKDPETRLKLRLCLYETFESSNYTQKLNYFEKYLSVYNESKDTAFVRHLTEKFGIDHKENHDLILKTLSGNTLKLKDILNSGKVTYIDFWATWCLPCIESLPLTKQLIPKYDKKKFQVIFVAINDSESRWKKFVTKNDMTTNSFFATNSGSSSFIEIMKLNEIPRYMIYDPKGKLYNSKAPKPDDPTLNKMIKSMIK
jgi:thiol-disulfide isomerase/thioredoxin